ncbi:MAG: glycyl-radical enzyme activating protein, partial [Clostridiaceae bacterium]|nr:glycyl-radical enzyme activating protein [Clostridiaceae bacterium]
MMTGLITKIQRFSVHDGPGIRTTVFLKGCYLECIWCQNPETIKSYPEVIRYSEKCIKCEKCVEVCEHNCFQFTNEEISFKNESCNQCWNCVNDCPTASLLKSANLYSSDEILDIVMRDNEFYKISGGGITLSGGEPFFQSEFCIDLLKKAKTRKLNTTIDTSGYTDLETLKRALPYIDLVLYDIKFLDKSLHIKYTGKSNVPILNNFDFLYDAQIPIRVRVPVIPNITDIDNNISKIEEYLSKYDKILGI